MRFEDDTKLLAKASFFSYHSANRTLENFPTGETDSQPANLKVEIDLRGQYEVDWSGRRGGEVEKKEENSHDKGRLRVEVEDVHGPET